MTDLSSTQAPSPFDWLSYWTPRSKPDGGAAPSLVQPILPGWSFGNVIVNETNSTAPDTEARIVSKKSYGQQIGILLDALAALEKDPGRQEADTRKALKAVKDLHKEVEGIKAEAAAKRMERIEADLDALRGKPDKTAYNEAATRLQAYLDRHRPKAADGAKAKPASAPAD